MSQAQSVDVPHSYKRLVKMVAYAFYSSHCPPKDHTDEVEDVKNTKKAQQLSKKLQQADTTGLGVVLLTALTEREWVKEDDLASDLQLHPKMVRRALRYLEHEQLVQRTHRQESLRGAQREAKLIGTELAEEEKEQIRQEAKHTISYCALDYPRIMDVVRFKLAALPKAINRELKPDNITMTFNCLSPACGRVYAHDEVAQLEMSAEGFLCGNCNTLVQQTLTADGGVAGDAAARRERVQHLEAVKSRLDEALKPLRDHVAGMQDLKPPDFNTYEEWKRAQMAGMHRENLAIKAEASSSKPPTTQTVGYSNIDIANVKIAVNLGAAGSGAAGSQKPAARPAAGLEAIAAASAAAASQAARKAASEEAARKASVYFLQGSAVRQEEPEAGGSAAPPAPPQQQAAAERQLTPAELREAFLRQMMEQTMVPQQKPAQQAPAAAASTQPAAEAAGAGSGAPQASAAAEQPAAATAAPAAPLAAPAAAAAVEVPEEDEIEWEEV